MKKILVSVPLLIFWIISAEKINFETTVIGILICSGMYFLNRDVEPVIVTQFFKINNIKHVFVYIFILIKEIVIANFQVAKIVLSKDMKISPGVVQFKTKLQKPLHKTILANSITLTPGTLTVLMEEDVLAVHCLQKEHTEDVINSKFEKILLKIEG